MKDLFYLLSPFLLTVVTEEGINLRIEEGRFDQNKFQYSCTSFFEPFSKTSRIRRAFVLALFRESYLPASLLTPYLLKYPCSKSFAIKILLLDLNVVLKRQLSVFSNLYQADC